MSAGRRRVILGAGALGLAIACRPRGALAPGEATTTVLSLQKIDCQSCGAVVVRAMERTPGIAGARFERSCAELTVVHDAAIIDGAGLLALVVDLGYGASLGPGRGAYTPEVEFPPDLDVRRIGRAGAYVDIYEHVAPGRITIFDFHAAWCGPCKKVDRHMIAVLEAHADVSLRKLDVVDWDSALARAYLRGVPSLPYVIVHGLDGAEVDRISGLDLDRLDAAIARARRA